MDASRIGSGRVQLQLEDVSIGDVVERAVESVRHLIDERGHELSLTVPPEPIWLRADAVRLEQIISQPPRERCEIHRARAVAFC